MIRNGGSTQPSTTIGYELCDDMLDEQLAQPTATVSRKDREAFKKRLRVILLLESNTADRRVVCKDDEVLHISS